jgi:transcriptional regulator with XRE-family HTH domain
MLISQNIRKLRELQNLSQEYMANRLSMSVSNYSKLERNCVPLTINRLSQISAVLNIQMIDIFSFNIDYFYNSNCLETLNNNNPSNDLNLKLDAINQKLIEIEILLRKK